MVEQANAWAVGDLERLRRLPSVDHKAACKQALLSSEVARLEGVRDLDSRISRHWVSVVLDSVREHDEVFATVPIARLLEEGGVTELLRAEGFDVTEPR